jgi:hypothetical protein
MGRPESAIYPGRSMAVRGSNQQSRHKFLLQKYYFEDNIYYLFQKYADWQ